MSADGAHCCSEPTSLLKARARFHIYEPVQFFIMFCDNFMGVFILRGVFALGLNSDSARLIVNFSLMPPQVALLTAIYIYFSIILQQSQHYNTIFDSVKQANEILPDT
jgi:hypothetical protein